MNARIIVPVVLALWLGFLNPARAAEATPPASPSKMKLMVSVLDKPGGKRVAAKVMVIDTTGDGDRLEGVSKEEPAAADDHLAFEVPKQHTFIVNAEKAGLEERQIYVAKTNAQDLVTLFLSDPSIATNKTRVTITLFDRPAGKRVPPNITVTDAANPATRFGEAAKTQPGSSNETLVVQLPKQHTFVIEAEGDGKKQRQYYTTRTNANENLAIYLGGYPPVRRPSAPPYVSPRATEPLPPATEAKLKAEATAYFAAATNLLAEWKFAEDLEEALSKNDPAVRRAVWEAFRASAMHQALKADFETNQVRFGSHLSPYAVKTLGTRPPGGWPLFIAMHGGGGAPQELNDSQWRVMQGYYRDHPEVGGYRYLALRAPDNTWNGFYTGYIYPLIANLKEQFLLFGDVDPDKVFIMGYSHGGYGAFAIGPKMPDHFAAIHASAGAPADGVAPNTLRNTVFTHMVGSEDKAYGRANLNPQFALAVDKLRGDRTDIFPVTFQLIQDNPHTGLPDRDKIAEMYPNVRNPVPRELTWLMTDDVIHDFFWLRTDAPGGGKEIDALCRDNKVTVTTQKEVKAASVLLDNRLVDFAKPVELEFNGKTAIHRLRPSLRTLCETMRRRGDPELSFTAEIRLPE